MMFGYWKLGKREFINKRTMYPQDNIFNIVLQYR